MYMFSLLISIWMFTPAFSQYLAMQLLYGLNFLKKKRFRKEIMKKKIGHSINKHEQRSVSTC